MPTGNPGGRNPFAYFSSAYKINKKTGCWNWQKGRNKRGYGQFWINDDKAMVTAHRYSYKHFRGEIPRHLIVLHTCDNPSCVNPDHLKLGTHSDNTQDMLSKGRFVNRTAVKETQTSMSELSAKDKATMKQMRRRSVKTAVIAKQYNVSFPSLCTYFRKHGLSNKIYKRV